MDALYRGIETSLLAFTLLLGCAAFALSGLPHGRPEAGASVTVPMLSVTADSAAGPIH